jgi:acetyl-CoA carboxylase carboxyltransferase component
MDGEEWKERVKEGERTYSTRVVEGNELGGEAAVDAQALLVEHGSEGERTERLGAGVVDALRVLVLAYDTTVSLGAWGHETAARTFELEGEVVLEPEDQVVRQVAALVVPPQEEDARRVPYLQGPEV